MFAKKRVWGGHQDERSAHPDADGPATPKHSSVEAHKQHAATSASPSLIVRSLHIASSVLQKVPGARKISLANAAFLGLLGSLALLAFLGGGLIALIVLLARLYLPALEAHHVLPLYFDYAAGPSAAGAWLPLLKHTPVTATLTPPAQQTSAAAAGLTFQGMLGPGGSFTVMSSSGSTAAADEVLGGKGGFLGLGLGPSSRLAARAASSSKNGGWLWGRKRDKSSADQETGSSSGSSSSSAVASTVEVGNGVVVPDQDWLVPHKGKASVGIELEMPGWPEPDLVQVTSELVSQQGIILGHSTRTWVPKPRPLLHRISLNLILGPWRAMGLIDDTVKVKLPMFEGYQNPQPPPGGWASVQGLAAAKPSSSGTQSSATINGGLGPGAVEPEGVAEVAGPRAMWLRVSLIGRSVGYGPPKVYRAAARLDKKLSFWDRVTAALRPSLTMTLLLAALGVGLMAAGGTGASILLPLAYVVYRWSNQVAAAAAGNDSSSESAQPDDAAEAARTPASVAESSAAEPAGNEGSSASSLSIWGFGKHKEGNSKGREGRVGEEDDTADSKDTKTGNHRHQARSRLSCEQLPPRGASPASVNEYDMKGAIDGAVEEAIAESSSSKQQQQHLQGAEQGRANGSSRPAGSDVNSTTAPAGVSAAAGGGIGAGAESSEWQQQLLQDSVKETSGHGEFKETQGGFEQVQGSSSEQQQDLEGPKQWQKGVEASASLDIAGSAVSGVVVGDDAESSEARPFQRIGYTYVA